VAKLLDGGIVLLAYKKQTEKEQADKKQDIEDDQIEEDATEGDGLFTNSPGGVLDACDSASDLTKQFCDKKKHDV
jgi:hypothetical protein